MEINKVVISTKRALKEFILTVQQRLDSIANELLQEHTTVVGSIVVAILDDLDSLCKLAKKHGRESLQHLKGVTWSTRPLEHGSLAGTYIGIGLGQNHLSLGFLENAVVDSLRAQITKNSKIESSSQESHSYDTMTGPLTSHADVYLTKKGAYEFTHTYTWFVKKRIE